MIQKRRKIVNIPGAEDWAGFKDDFTARNAQAFWFGKSLDEMQTLFGGTLSIQRGQELLYMPRRAFQFYIFAFAQFVMSEAAIGDSDTASVFLTFLAAREKRDPGSVAQVYERLEPTIGFVAASQARFHASHDLYGDFVEQAALLQGLCGARHSPRDPEDQMLDPTDDA